MSTLLRYSLLSGLAGALLDALLGSTRFVAEGEDNFLRYRKAGQPVIFVLWHGRLLPLSYRHRGQGIVTLVSRSADGEYLARILEHWGFVPARGSSNRGGTTALRELVRHARAGRSLAITPDGPRGPRQKLKPGVLLAAQLTGAPLVPVAAAASRGWWLGKWDRFLVPRPFARIHVLYGTPICVPRELQGQSLEEWSGRVEETLNELMLRADDRVRG